MTKAVDSESEGAYNDWYDNVHLADVLKLAGYTAARRYKPVPNPQGVDSTGGIDWTYLALYEVEADDLEAAHAHLLAAFEAGELPLSEALQMEPEPVVQMYEQITELTT
jgi:hypothetical protein